MNETAGQDRLFPSADGSEVRFRMGCTTFGPHWCQHVDNPNAWSCVEHDPHDVDAARLDAMEQAL